MPPVAAVLVGGGGGKFNNIGFFAIFVWSIPRPEGLSYLDGVPLLAEEAALLRSLDDPHSQSAFRFSAYSGLLSLSVRCCGSLDEDYVQTFDTTAASVSMDTSGLNYLLRHESDNNIKPGNATMRMGCGAPPQPWKPQLCEELFGLSFLPRACDSERERERERRRGL